MKFIAQCIVVNRYNFRHNLVFTCPSTKPCLTFYSGRKALSLKMQCKASQILTGNSSDPKQCINELGCVSGLNFSKCTPNDPSILASASLVLFNAPLICYEFLKFDL